MKQLLISLLYKNDKAIPMRFTEEWFVRNGYEEVIQQVNEHINSVLSENTFDFPTQLKMILNDQLFIPICHTCKCTHLQWQKQKKRWSKYCSMKCCQNDPDVKESMLAGQKDVDWSEKVEKRQNTMMNTYGVIAISQLQENRDAMSIRSSEMWKDQKKVEHAKIVRASTNLEKYGVEVISQDPEIQKRLVAKATETRNSKSVDERKIF